jgi:hypothetical protein
LAQRKIGLSNSPYLSPIILTQKKLSNKYRMCVDYRKLNMAINQDAFAMPLPSQIFMNMQGKEVFTKLDLSSAYHQIRVDKKS